MNQLAAVPPDDCAGDNGSSEEVPSFAPDGRNDNRAPGFWQTRYADDLARRWILIEAVYVLLSFAVCASAIAVIAIDAPSQWLELSDDVWSNASPFALAFVGGGLGGTLFAMKWLYHSVAKQLWNIDRRLWRFFTPLLSAGAALTIVVLSAGGVLPFFGRDIVRSDLGALGIALLVGYFSDRTFSMLEKFADNQFGQRPKKKKNEH